MAAADGSGGLAQLLEALDKRLRCPVCYDFLHLAVMFPTCAHIYCSECIRRALSFQERCPTCRRPARHTELQSCRKVDELVAVWRVHEAAVQATLTAAPAPSDVPQPSAVSQSPARTIAASPRVLTQERRVEECQGCGVSVVAARMAQHRAKCLASEAGADGFYEGEKETYKAQASADGELRPGQRRLTAPCFAIMSDKEIKKLMRETGLEVTGKRTWLIRRYKEYVLQFNVQLDSLQPLSKDHIIRKVNRDLAVAKFPTSLTGVTAKSQPHAGGSRKKGLKSYFSASKPNSGSSVDLTEDSVADMTAGGGGSSFSDLIAKVKAQKQKKKEQRELEEKRGDTEELLVLSPSVPLYSSPLSPVVNPSPRRSSQRWSQSPSPVLRSSPRLAQKETLAELRPHLVSPEATAWNVTSHSPAARHRSPATPGQLRTPSTRSAKSSRLVTQTPTAPLPLPSRSSTPRSGRTPRSSRKEAGVRRSPRKAPARSVVRKSPPGSTRSPLVANQRRGRKEDWSAVPKDRGLAQRDDKESVSTCDSPPLSPLLYISPVETSNDGFILPGPQEMRPHRALKRGRGSVLLESSDLEVTATSSWPEDGSDSLSMFAPSPRKRLKR